MNTPRICARLGCKKRVVRPRIYFCCEECYRIAFKAKDNAMRSEEYHTRIKPHAEKFDAHRRQVREAQRRRRERFLAAGLTTNGTPRKRP